MENPRISIIGAGPAGIASSIQLKRLGYEPLLFEKEKLGGLLWNANLIENYPGFPGGINGPELVDLMEKQVKQLEIALHRSKIDRLVDMGGYFQLEYEGKKTFSDYVVIATGTKPRTINIDSSESVKNLFHYDIRSILNLSEKHIVIIGAGDAAFDQALNLSRKNHVTILNRGSNNKALQLLVNRTLANEKITYLDKTVVEDIKLLRTNTIVHGKNLLIRCNSVGKKINIECDEIVVAIGRDPQLDFLDQIVNSEKCMLVGDVKNGIFRQSTIAIGDGVMAAMKIHNQIIRGNE